MVLELVCDRKLILKGLSMTAYLKQLKQKIAIASCTVNVIAKLWYRNKPTSLSIH